MEINSPKRMEEINLFLYKVQRNHSEWLSGVQGKRRGEREVLKGLEKKKSNILTLYHYVPFEYFAIHMYY